MHEPEDKEKKVIRDLLLLVRRIAKQDDKEKREELLEHALRIAKEAGVSPKITRKEQ